MFFCSIDHQVIMIFLWFCKKSAEIKAMYYTLIAEGSPNPGQPHWCLTKDAGHVTGNLTLKEFQTQTKSISVRTAWAAQAPVLTLVCADLFYSFAIFVREPEKKAPTSAQPLSTLCVVCVTLVRLRQTSAFCQGVHVPLPARGVSRHAPASYLNSPFVHHPLLPKKETQKSNLEG